MGLGLIVAGLCLDAIANLGPRRGEVSCHAVNGKSEDMDAQIRKEYT